MCKSVIIYLYKIQSLINVFKRHDETLKKKVIADVLLSFGYPDFSSRASAIGNKRIIVRPFFNVRISPVRYRSLIHVEVVPQ